MVDLGLELENAAINKKKVEKRGLNEIDEELVEIGQDEVMGKQLVDGL